MGGDERGGGSEPQWRRRAWLGEGHFGANRDRWQLC